MHLTRRVICVQLNATGRTLASKAHARARGSDYLGSRYDCGIIAYSSFFPEIQVENRACSPFYSSVLISKAQAEFLNRLTIASMFELNTARLWRYCTFIHIIVFSAFVSRAINLISMPFVRCRIKRRYLVMYIYVKTLCDVHLYVRALLFIMNGVARRRHINPSGYRLLCIMMK